MSTVARYDAPSDTACLGVFAKYWASGEVKTRLIGELTDAQAADLYYACLTTTLQRLAYIARERFIAFTPTLQREAFSKLAPTWRLTPQCDGDLGRRLADFFQRQFAAGQESIVVVGADSPHLPTRYVEAAFTALETHDAVLGPTEDGGYYLVGARETTPPIFAAMPWGTPAVWTETIARLDQARISKVVLPVWYDIDRPDDLHRLRLDLAAAENLDPPLKELQARIDAITQGAWRQ